MAKRILFISAANLTTDPRIYKELQLAIREGYQVTFVGFKLGNWTDLGDEEIKKKFPSIDLIYFDATRTNYGYWLYSSLLNLFCRYLWILRKRSLYLSAVAHSKRTIPLLSLCKKLSKNNYDLIVGHTLPVLYPIFKSSSRTNCHFAFDVEDYHPGESIDKDVKNEKKRREFLFKAILPDAFYISGASPLISHNVEKLVPGTQVKTVMNYFSNQEFTEPALTTSEKLKLVWFSQNINGGRGLELVLSVWEELKQHFELTLIGKIDDDFYIKYIKKHEDIIIKMPMTQKELHQSLGFFDIGLAIDVDNEDYNRKLAITNKILAYYQAGLYIFATDTAAQQAFIKERPLHGMFTEQKSAAVYHGLMNIYSIKSQIRKEMRTRYKYASLSSWEIESQIILNEWGKIK